MLYLHTYTHPVYSDIVEPYTLDRDEVQWFVDQYKCRLDQYIRVAKKIDVVVHIGELNIRAIAGNVLNWSNGEWVGGNEIENYGHPNFFGTDGRYRVNEVKKYYEERLGISDLTIVY